MGDASTPFFRTTNCTFSTAVVSIVPLTAKSTSYTPGFTSMLSFA